MGQSSASQTKVNTKNEIAWTLVFICWIVASVSTLGSLFFSEIMGFPPCTLCWYQRICMYPLVLIFLAGLFPLDKSLLKFSLPLSFLGWTIALYHILLYVGIIPENLSPCAQGVSCATKFFEWFGFISIPVLSIAGFTVLILLQLIIRTQFLKEKK